MPSTAQRMMPNADAKRLAIQRPMLDTKMPAVKKRKKAPQKRKKEMLITTQTLHQLIKDIEGLPPYQLSTAVSMMVAADALPEIGESFECNLMGLPEMVLVKLRSYVNECLISPDLRKGGTIEVFWGADAPETQQATTAGASAAGVWYEGEIVRMTENTDFTVFYAAENTEETISLFPTTEDERVEYRHVRKVEQNSSTKPPDNVSIISGFSPASQPSPSSEAGAGDATTLTSFVVETGRGSGRHKQIRFHSSNC